LYEEFKAAIDGSDGRILPEDDLDKKPVALNVSSLKSKLQRGFAKVGDATKLLETIQEEGN
jgi:hypothetical protein